MSKLRTFSESISTGQTYTPQGRTSVFGNPPKIAPLKLIGKLTQSNYDQKLKKAAKEIGVSPRRIHDVIFNVGLADMDIPDGEKYAKAMDSSVADIRRAAKTPGLVVPWLLKQANLGTRRGYYQKWLRAIKKGRASSVAFHKVLAKLERSRFPFAEEKDILRRALETTEAKLKFDRLLKLKNPIEKEKELRKMFFQEGNDPKVPLGDNYHPSVGWY